MFKVLILQKVQV